MTQTFVGTLYIEECCSCGVHFGMTKETYKIFRDNHKDFSCPFGHLQHYTGKSESEQLNDERKKIQQLEKSLKYTQESRDYYQQKNEDHKNALRATKGVVTKMKNRVANGVCPCCTRTFTNLKRHIADKHPNYKKED